MTEPILCYVSGACAFFTTQPLDKQWGDDWNDAPYEHNAGHPYEPSERHEGSDYTDGKPNWKISRVAFDGPLEAPCEAWEPRLSVSVEDMNIRKLVPWLTENRYSAEKREAVKIWAGTPLSEFRRLVAKAGGTVYEPVPVSCASAQEG